MDDDKSQETENKEPEAADKEQAAEPENSSTAVPEPKNRGLRFGSKKLWLVILPLLLLAAGLLAMTYLYQQKASRTDELNEEVALLQQAVSDKDSQLQELQSANGDTGNPDEPVSSGNTCTGGSSYTADIGNFTVTVDDPYVIIRELDAGFEGGPATRLNVASCLEGESNVFDSSYQRDVNITANPQASAEGLRTAYESNNGELTANGTVEVDGVTADRYTSNALFETTVLFFDRNGIGYQIEASGTPSEFNPLLDDVVDDWVFEA